jgi:hypothetical protein
MPPPEHSVRIRDGEREIEVIGNPAFVRQVLDDLPTLMGRLRGEAPGRTTISMPPPPDPRPEGGDTTGIAPSASADVTKTASTVDPAAAPNGNGSRRGASTTAVGGSLEQQIFEVLRGSGRPLAVAAIRQRLDGDEVTGQQVRRLLERAGTRVVVSSDRPATYSLR